MAHVVALRDFGGQPGQPGPLARVRESIANYRRFRAVHDELNALTDRELADLGLSRLAIGDIARQAVYGN